MTVMPDFRIVRRTLTAAVLATAAAATTTPVSAQSLETSATHAILLDLSTDTVLFAKQADARIAPASMSKLITIEVLFRAISEGRLTLDDTFPVSEKAWRMGGSKMFVAVGDDIRVEDLLRGIIVSSGNDACIVVAEGMDGTEEAFADRLNHRANELGLTDSNFVNASGWPDPQHYMSMRDLAKLSAHIIRSYPDLYPIFAEERFEWEGVDQPNRNPLLHANIGADGLKTGHVEESGYALAGTAVRGDRRLVLVLTGLESIKQRASESRRLLAWGFREFRSGVLFEAGEKVGQASIWMGEQPQVDVVVGETIHGSLPVIGGGTATATLHIAQPVPAPVAAGDPLGTIVIRSDTDTHEFLGSLLAGHDVPAGNLFVRVLTLLEHAVLGEEPE